MKIYKKIVDFFTQVGTYRIVTNPGKGKHTAFIVQVRGLLWWHKVKTFASDDAEYAKICAYELLETLEEDIEPKQRD